MEYQHTPQKNNYYLYDQDIMIPPPPREAITTYSINDDPKDDWDVGIPNWRNIISTHWTTPICYKDMLYSSVESAYQAQKFCFIKDDENAGTLQKYYQQYLEFDHPFGIDISKSKYVGSKEGFCKMNITLNTSSWNYHKYEVMSEIMKVRYNTDIEFKYIVDMINYNNLNVVCCDKGNYWSGKISKNGRVIVGNNNLGKIIKNLKA